MYIGYSFFAGIGVFVLSIIAQGLLAQAVAYYQREYMKKQDERVSLTTEGLNNIKMLKLYSWSDVFTDMIATIRNQELGLLLQKKRLEIITVACFNFFPSMLRVAAFTAYYGSGHTMTIDLAFAITTILDIIYIPMGWLPLYIGHVVEFQVSVDRLEKFFNQEEINTSVRSEELMNCDVTVNGDWIWGVSKAGDDKKKHKEVLEERKKAQKSAKLPQVEDLDAGENATDALTDMEALEEKKSTDSSDE